MKRRFSTGTVLALMLLAAALTYLLSLVSINETYNAKLKAAEQTIEQAKTFLEAETVIEQNFVGDWDADTLMDGAISGMVGSLGDRWSHYLTAEQYEAYQNADAEFVGIGVTVTPVPDSQRLQISSVYSDSPAQEAGIAPYDIIISVDGIDVETLGYQGAVNRVRGEEYTVVSLTLIRAADETTYTVNVTRRAVKAERVTSEILDGDIGYIRVRSFNERVDEEFASALNQLLDAEIGGLIVDVRYNPGGRLDVLVSMLDQFLDECNLITLRRKDGTEVQYSAKDGKADLPLIVLVNGESYSAAEFFAVCLSEYDRVQTVGDSTTGKGYAQVPIELSGGSAIVLSVEEYFTPTGRSLAGVGYEPDVVLEVPPEESASFTDPLHKGDRQFEKAVDLMRAQLLAPAG